MARSAGPGDPEEDADKHAAERDRQRERERSGMRVTGRTTRSLLPGLIARRGREASQRIARHPQPPPTEDADGG